MKILIQYISKCKLIIEILMPVVCWGWSQRHDSIGLVKVWYCLCSCFYLIQKDVQTIVLN